MKKEKTNSTNKEDLKDANIALGAGAGLGAYAGWTFSVGAVCPVCVVAAPALIGIGLWGKYKNKVKPTKTNKDKKDQQS